MPDLTMCTGKQCSAKEHCYRFRARPIKYWQSYFDVVPGEDTSCKFFMPVTAEDSGCLRPMVELETFEEFVVRIDNEAHKGGLHERKYDENWSCC